MNLRRIIQNAQQIFHNGRYRASDLRLEEIVLGVKELCMKLLVVRGDTPLVKEAQENATLLFQCLLRSRLAARRVIEEFKLNRASFEWVMGEIETQFQNLLFILVKWWVLWQLNLLVSLPPKTLNTFHYAGVSSKNVTLGLKKFLMLPRTLKHQQ